MKKFSKLILGVLLTVTLVFAFASCGEQKTLESISITNAPDKVSYWAGETFDATGMEVTAHYSTGDEVLTEGYTIDKEGVALTASDTKITVTYEGLKATQKITVTENVETFTLTRLPTKLDYTSDKTVDLTGIAANVSDTKGTSTDLTASDLSGTLDGDVVTVTYKEHSASFTVKTEELDVVNIGTTDWYGTDNEPSLLGTWDTAADEDSSHAGLPAIDTAAGTATFTDTTWSRLPVFCVKYYKTNGTYYEAGNNIGAQVMDHVDGQTFQYSLNVNADGDFRLGFLMAKGAVYALTDSYAMGIMLHFDGSTMTLASNEGGGTDVVLATAETQFVTGEDNRIDFTFMRSAHKVTFTVYVNGIRVYFNDVNMSAASDSALENGNYTFMAGGAEDDDQTITSGYKNYGNRLGVYAGEGTTVVLSDVK